MSSDDFEQLERETEDLQNVVGVARIGPGGVPTVLVTEKKPESELDPDQLVSNNTHLDRDEHDVIEVGEIVAQPDQSGETEIERALADEDAPETSGPEPVAGRVDSEASREYNPIPAGAEEQPAGETWVGTGGPLARIVNSSKGRWDEQIDRGDVVRLSNFHVYMGDDYQTGHNVNHPFRGRTVGTVVGGVPLQDGVRVDVAARTVSPDDGWGAAGLADRYGRGVEEDISGLVGEQVTKSGRTTRVTVGTVRAIGANVNVRYGSGTHRIEDTIITERMGAGGDSGSAVYVRSSGDLVSLHFAGSSEVSVSAPIKHVMEDFGVQPITNWERGTPPSEYAPPMRDGPMPIWWRFPFKIPFRYPFDLSWLRNRLSRQISEYDFEDLVEAYFIEEFGEENVQRQYYFKDMVRYSDLMVETPVGKFAMELENDFEACFKGVGQTLVYAGHSEDWYPMVILPEGEAGPKDQQELEYLRRAVPILEFPVPDADESEGAE